VSVDRVISIIPTTEYFGATTNFSIYNPESVYLVLENQHGKINYTDELNLTFGPDIDEAVEINLNFTDVSIYSELNNSARISFYNLPYVYRPIILRDQEICEFSICEFEDYSANTLIFNVTHFSSYSASSNSRLHIYDQTHPIIHGYTTILSSK